MIPIGSAAFFRAVHRLFERAQAQGDADNRGDYQTQALGRSQARRRSSWRINMVNFVS
jgi:hypothetical protein